ncbi:MAG: hypothetical protein FWD27_04310 [Coriobacteriia bacterium]|nr:hypothetical protein [Coriobacteriia bacterium]
MKAKYEDRFVDSGNWEPANITKEEAEERGRKARQTLEEAIKRGKEQKQKLKAS